MLGTGRENGHGQHVDEVVTALHTTAAEAEIVDLADILDLIGPGLNLKVGEDVGVRLIPDAHIVADPRMNCIPDEQGIVAARGSVASVAP
jgi:hypothetical protein